MDAPPATDTLLPPPGRRTGAGWLRLWGGVLLALLVIPVGLAVLSPADTDYWTHLALGRVMWESKSLDIPEPFLGYAQGRPLETIAPHHALFGLLAFGLQSLAGDAGIRLLLVLAGSAILLLLWRRVPAEGGPVHILLAWLFLLAALSLVLLRILPRPELLAYPLGVLTLTLAWGWRLRASWGRLAAVGASLAAWRMVHVSWVLGLFLAFPVILLWPQGDFWRREWATRRGRILIALSLLAASLACLGAILFLVPVLGDLVKGKAMAGINEMHPLTRFPALLLHFSLAGAFALALAWGGRNDRWRRVLLALLAAVPALLATRNLAFSAIGLAFPALEGLKTLRLPGGKGWTRAAATVLVLSTLGTASLWGVFLTRQARSLPSGPPWTAARFVADNHLPSPVMNQMEMGGFLNWAWNGTPPTFLDGRDMGDNRVFLDYLAMLSGPDTETLLRQYGIRTVLTRSQDWVRPELFPLFEHLQGSDDWKLVHRSDALVYVRQPPPGLPLLDKKEGWAFAQMEARRRALGTSSPHLPFILGACMLGQGQRMEAMSFFLGAIRRYPELYPRYSAYLARLGIPAPGPSTGRGAPRP